MSTLFYGAKVGGVGSGKYMSCRHCSKPIEQPPAFPRVVQAYCGPKCERAAAESESDSEWSADDERLAQMEALRFRK